MEQNAASKNIAARLSGQRGMRATTYVITDMMIRARPAHMVYVACFARPYEHRIPPMIMLTNQKYSEKVSNVASRTEGGGHTMPLTPHRVMATLCTPILTKPRAALRARFIHDSLR